MASKSRSSTGGILGYQEVEPQYQWVSAKDVDTIVVDLTGFEGEEEFKKEHLKVRIDNRGNIKVSGERRVGASGDRFIRFEKVFRVGDDCNTAEIKAKFENGVLTVTMPKLIKDQPVSPPEAPAPVPAVKPDAKTATTPTKAPEEAKAQDASPPENERRGAERDKEGKPVAEKPAPPTLEGEGPRYRTATMRRSRWVAMGAVVVATVVLLGLGFYHYYRSFKNGVNPDEEHLQLQQLDGFGDY